MLQGSQLNDETKHWTTELTRLWCEFKYFTRWVYDQTKERAAEVWPEVLQAIFLMLFSKIVLSHVAGCPTTFHACRLAMLSSNQHNASRNIIRFTDVLTVSVSHKTDTSSADASPSIEETRVSRKQGVVPEYPKH